MFVTKECGTRRCVLRNAPLHSRKRGPMRYRVQIIHRESGKVDLDMRGMSYRRAKHVESGASRNLDHENYYTAIKPDPGEEELPEPCKSECPEGGVDHCTGCLD